MMKLIAITSPHFREGESQTICRLLDRGWWRVHIRKPDAPRQRVEELIKSIPEKYRPSLSLHDHFELVQKLGIGGVHLNSRNPDCPAHIDGLVSRSCHTVDELKKHSHLDYLFLSPVFDSISKPGYSSQFDMESLRGLDLHNVFALGGVTFGHLDKIRSFGFEGAAMLSEAWKTGNGDFQFITHTFNGLEEALKGGCRWVQLRMKDASDEDFSEMAMRFIPVCRKYGATLIFDDRVHLVDRLKADGVHLGKNDMPITEARKILGPGKIIGATANTADDIRAAYKAGADYIGLGPFRFTTTKKNLSPVLGLEGYRRIITECRNEGIVLPIVAIGGIGPDDLNELRHTGVDGVAVSGIILNSKNIKETTEKIIFKWENS